MYQKNFQQWSQEKEKLHNEEGRENFSPRVGEIFWAKLGVNIGVESDGKKFFLKPVLILSKIGSLYLILPLTSRLKENIFHHTLQSVQFENAKKSVVMLSQVKVVDKKRLIKLLDQKQRVSKEEMVIIQKEVKRLLFPSL